MACYEPHPHGESDEVLEADDADEDDDEVVDTIVDEEDDNADEEQEEPMNAEPVTKTKTRTTTKATKPKGGKAARKKAHAPEKRGRGRPAGRKYTEVLYVKCTEEEREAFLRRSAEVGAATFSDYIRKLARKDCGLATL